MLPPSSMMTTKKGRNSLKNLVVIAATGIFLTGCTPPGAKEAREGEKLIQAGKFADAVGPLKEATEILATAPLDEQSKIWNLLGLAYHGEKQLDAASDAYLRAIKMNRNNAAADYNLGCLRLDQGDYPGSIDYLTTYTTVHSHDVRGYLRLGTAHWRLALERTGAQRNVLIATARQDFANAERTAVTAEAPTCLGVIEMQRSAHPSVEAIKAAVADFQLAVDRDKEYWPAVLNLAILQQQYLNQPILALKNYRAYLAVRPPLPHTREVEKAAHQLDLDIRITITPERHDNPVSAPARSAPPPTNLAPIRPKPVTVEAPAEKAPALASSATITEKAAAPAAVAPPPTPPPKGVVAEPAPAPPVRTPVIAPSPAPSPASPTNETTEFTQVEVAPPQAATPRRSFAEKINPLHWFSGAPKTTNAPDADTPLVPKGSHYKYPLIATPIPGERTQALRWSEEGAQARHQGRFAEAVRDYQQAVQADPTFFDACLALGLAAVDAHDYHAALGGLTRALALDGDSAEARYAFAWTLQKRGYYEDAARELEKLLSTHPDEVRGRLLLGNLYAEKLKQPKQAREQYSKALEADPENPQAAAIRAWLATGGK
jgi:tetratricopeptide (TPR) repeat protein